ncbi:MAG: hypothetical protein K6G55_03965 [Selenomonadaceae bacterium]|nr:hypothetical protein [Selenomonadaceae bacterium]
MANFKIKIFGLGDGGAQAITKMISKDLGKNKNVEYIGVGADENILLTSMAKKNIFLNLDRATIYRKVADTLEDAKLIFLVGGLGSSVAKEIIPVILSCAKYINAVVVAFMSSPFVLETSRRKDNAQYTLANLVGNVDSLFTVPSEKLLLSRLNQQQVAVSELFDLADDIFYHGVKLFLEEITDDEESLLVCKWGCANFGYGYGATMLEAITAATNFILFTPDDFANASGVFIRCAAGNTVSRKDIDRATDFIYKLLPDDVKIFSQMYTDDLLGDKVVVTIVLTRKTVDDKNQI